MKNSEEKQLTPQQKASIGNDWWKLRATSGRSKIWQNPQDLWEDCKEYFEVTKTQSIKKIEYVGKDAERVEIPLSVPFTMSGLYVFLDIDANTWLLYEKRQDFIPITTRVKNIIFTNKYNGAMVGTFNANIVKADLGLIDKRETQIKIGLDAEEETYE